MRKLLFLLVMSTNLFAASSVLEDDSAWVFDATPYNFDPCNINDVLIDGSLSIFDQEGRGIFKQRVGSIAQCADATRSPDVGLDSFYRTLAEEGLDSVSDVEARMVKYFWGKMYNYQLSTELPAHVLMMSFSSALKTLAEIMDGDVEARKAAWASFRKAGAWALKEILEDRMNKALADKEQHINLTPAAPAVLLENNKNVPMDDARRSWYKAGTIVLMMLSEYNRRLDPEALFQHPMNK